MLTGLDRCSPRPPDASISIQGAREHNLKNLSLEIPRGKFVVVTGVSGSGKSTVATVTEVYHFLRLLFARLGTQYCPDCRLPVAPQTRDQLAAGLRGELKKRGDLLLLAPVVRNRKGFHHEVAEWAAQHGYREIRADGKLFDHELEIVVT